MGVACRYDGKGKLHEQISELMDKFHLIPICPEIMGGLPTPRLPAEIIGENVVNREGVDVTHEFELGAQKVLDLAKLYQCKYAILKEKSPSCGYGKIYDGSFSGQLIEGNGILSKLLIAHGIQVFGESKIDHLLSKTMDAIL